jgi:hypothetical protein
MSKLVMTCFLLILFVSCKQATKIVDDKNKKFPNGKEFCELLLKMYDDDVKYRELTQDPFFEILDSIKISEGITNETYKKFSTEKQLSFGRRARNIANRLKPKFTKKEEDSLWVLQIELDDKNTELLIDIIKEKGYPTKNNTECIKFPGHVFRHSQPEYFEEIKELITVEYKEGRLDRIQYTFFMNHVNYREDYDNTNDRVNNMKVKDK